MTVSVVAAAVEHSLEPAASLVVHQPPSVASAVSPVDFYVEQTTAQLETVEWRYPAIVKVVWEGDW